jgi:hypothetical protein
MSGTGGGGGWDEQETAIRTEQPSEPAQMHPNGSRVAYRRDDGWTGYGTVASYDRVSGRFRIQTKTGIVTRFWSGVQRTL